MSGPAVAGNDADAPSAEIARARALVLKHGWNATAFQIVNPGFRLWFSRLGDAVAGLVEYAGVWVVAGAPVAAADRLKAVVEELETDANQAGREVCYFGAEARLEAIGRSSGRHTLDRRVMAVMGALNSAGFADYYGPTHTRMKVAYSLRRLRPPARRHLDHLHIRADVRAMIDAHESAR